MIKGTAQTYTVFVRNFWRIENGRKVPDSTARRTVIARGCTEEEARQIAKNYNANNAPGPLSRKAEFTS